MNKVFLIGNLTRDPEMRTTQQGHSVCKFGLAVNRRRKVEGQPEADFYNISAWRQLGETAMRYLSKGRKVAVVGNLTVNTYVGNDGTQRYSLDVDADDIEFLPNAGQQGMEGGGGGGYARPATPAPAAAPAAPSGFEPAETGFTQVDEDELPF